MRMESEGVASPPGDLLRFVPTLLTFAVLGGAAIIAMGGLKHDSSAGVTTAPEAVAPATLQPAALRAVEPASVPLVSAEVVYIVDSPSVQEALETSPTLERDSDQVDFSVLLVQTPADQLAAQQMIAGIGSELTALGIELEVIDLRDPPPVAP
ncbi:MAG TPA: hypothetical protein VFY10_07170 [Dehalococcoidia bacterium]|nr:hypothetical protein [Dehalococcoidia bacterium]